MAEDILDVLELRDSSAQPAAARQIMFEKTFSFNGRIRRTEFGISLAIYFVFYVMIYGMIFSIRRGHEPSATTNFAVFIFIIPMLWFLWAQSAKRCHDLGHSGWYQLIPFYVLWMLFQDGQPGENEYGENPKEVKDVYDENDKLRL